MHAGVAPPPWWDPQSPLLQELQSALLPAQSLLLLSSLAVASKACMGPMPASHVVSKSPWETGRRGSPYSILYSTVLCWCDPGNWGKWGEGGLDGCPSLLSSYPAVTQTNHGGNAIPVSPRVALQTLFLPSGEAWWGLPGVLPDLKVGPVLSFLSIATWLFLSIAYGWLKD